MILIEKTEKRFNLTDITSYQTLTKYIFGFRKRHSAGLQQYLGSFSLLSRHYLF